MRGSAVAFRHHVLRFGNRRGLPFGNIWADRGRVGGSPGEASEGFPSMQTLFYQQVATKKGEAYSYCFPSVLECNL